MINDLILNLVAELIGILLTVFLIDQLIARRDRKRWDVTRNYAFARLFREIERFLASSGVDALGKQYESTQFFYWGTASAAARADYSGRSLLDLREVCKEPAALQVMTDVFRVEELRELRRALYSTLDLAAHLLDPELQQSILALDDNLATAPRFAKVEAKHRADTYALYLSNILELRHRLASMASRRATLQDALAAIRKRP